MRWPVLSLCLAVACHGKREDGAPAPASAPSTLAAAVPAGDPTASAAREPDAAARDAGPVAPASACPPLAPAPLATCAAAVVKAPPPDLDDPTGSLAPFWGKLAALERGTARRRLRIGMYGDSNLTSDFLSGHLRRVLQGRYGDAGHGWISLSRPWGSYHHEDVTSAGFWPMFQLYAPTTHPVRDRQYGFANMAAESREVGATAWAATTKDPKATVGRAVAHFELHYLQQPHGGSLRLLVDKREVRTVPTAAEAFGLGVEEVDVDDGPHELRAEVRGDGPVRLFGTSLDRVPGPDRPGVQLDSLGAGALNFQCLGLVGEGVRRAGLERRAYDLVILWLGMNVMFVPPNEAFTNAFLDALRTALPDTPILMLSPGDTSLPGEKRSNPRIVAVVEQLRRIAHERGIAFWDFREAMGGEASILAFTRRGLTGEDHIHFGPEGSRLMGDRLLCAASRAFDAFLAAHPTAGCAP